MRRSKFTESRIVAALQEVEGGVPIAEMIRGHGISRATFVTWKSRYGGATVAELNRLRGLESDMRSSSGCTRTSRSRMRP
jgi:putative transposase